MSEMNSVRENLATIRQRISEAAERLGRNPDEITLIGVSKTKPVEVIEEAIAAGLADIGENRIQEARQKLPELQNQVRRHMIGTLQRNKVKYAVKLFDMIQSVDSIALAEDIDARCAKMGRQMPVLIEVNTSGEEQKHGCTPQSSLTLLQAVDRLPNICVRGFMTIAVYSNDPEIVRPCFRTLKEIYDKAVDMSLRHATIDTLSMGMSHDFELAIEEGANMIRVGTAIFGARNMPQA